MVSWKFCWLLLCQLYIKIHPALQWCLASPLPRSSILFALLLTPKKFPIIGDCLVGLLPLLEGAYYMGRGVPCLQGLWWKDTKALSSLVGILQMGYLYLFLTALWIRQWKQRWTWLVFYLPVKKRKSKPCHWMLCQGSPFQPHCLIPIFGLNWPPQFLSLGTIHTSLMSLLP